MRKLYGIILFLCFSVCCFGQAGLQFIHNSPLTGSDSLPVFDIYLNGVLRSELTAIAFRQATPFLEVADGMPVEVGVALAGDPITDTLAFLNLEPLNAGQNYIVSLVGMQGDSSRPIAFSIWDDACINSGSGEVHFQFMHGSPEAPPLDIYSRRYGLIANNVDYADYTNYATYAEALDFLLLDVKVAGATDISASYFLNFSELEDQCATIFMSGQLSTSPDFGLFAALSNGEVKALPFLPLVQLQYVHNTQLQGYDAVDVYVNNSLWLDDIGYLEASAYSFSLAGSITVAVAPDTSTSANSAFYNHTINAENGDEIQIFANGLINDPTNPFSLNLRQQQTTHDISNDVFEVTFHNGSSHLDPLVLQFRNENDPLIENLSYREFSQSFRRATGRYFLDILHPANGNIMRTYTLSLQNGGGIDGTLFSSNRAGSANDYEFYLLTRSGLILPLSVTTQGQIQFVQAAEMEEIDVYVNDVLRLDNQAYLSATNYQLYDAGVPITIKLAPSESASSAEAFDSLTLTLGIGETYQIIASGNINTSIDQFVKLSPRTVPTDPSLLDMNVFHASSSIGGIDVQDMIKNIDLVVDLDYGEFAGYASFPPDAYIFRTRQSESQEIAHTVFTFLNGGSGKTGTILIAPTEPSAEEIGMYFVLSDGTVIGSLPIAVVDIQFINNTRFDTLDVFFGDFLLAEQIAPNKAIPYSASLSTRDSLKLSVAHSIHQNVDSAFYDFSLSIEDGEAYILIGVGDSPDDFELKFFSNAQKKATSGPDSMDIIVFNEIVPSLELLFEAQDTYVVLSIPLGEFIEHYVSLGARNMMASFYSDTFPTYMETWWEANTFGGQSVTLFTSVSEQVPHNIYDVYAALASGETFPLNFFTINVYEPSRTFGSLNVFPNPADQRVTLKADLSHSIAAAHILLFNASGMLVKTQDWGSLSAGENSQTLAIQDLPTGSYYIVIYSEDGVLHTPLQIVDR